MLPTARRCAAAFVTRTMARTVKSANRRAYSMRTVHMPRGVCKLAIFDKTGTLTCFDTMYAHWCEDTAVKLSAAFARDVRADFYDVTKYDPRERKVLKGGISENPHHVLKQRLVDLVMTKYGVEMEKARDAVMNNWDKAIDPDDSEIGNYFKPLGDIAGVLGALKENGIKIAICTADNRQSAEKIMKYFGVSDMIDVMRCGDDHAVIPKPDPSNVYSICADTRVKPANTAVIGDTPTDLKLGRNAKVGTTVGVLCGVASRADLEPYADEVVGNVEEALPILLRGYKTEKRLRAEPREHQRRQAVQAF